MENNRTIIVGDIHGCFRELILLLEQVCFQSNDRLISVGDFVDRGLESSQVFEFFRDTPNADAIMGNHEHKHLLWNQHKQRPAISQQITRKQMGEKIYAEFQSFLLTLPLFYDLPEAIVVHGCFEPGVSLAAQSVDVLVGHLQAEKQIKHRYSKPWYELYNGSKLIIVGHHNYAGTGDITIFNDRIWAIDTGCVHGGRLSALILPGYDIVSVSSEDDHWMHVRMAYPEIRYGKDREIIDYPWRELNAMAERFKRYPEQGFDMAKQIIQFRDDSYVTLYKLYQWLENENERICQLLVNENSEFFSLSHSEQAQLYKQKLKIPRFFGLLNKARQGRLDMNTMEQLTRCPKHALDLFQEIQFIE